MHRVDADGNFYKDDESMEQGNRRVSGIYNEEDRAEDDEDEDESYMEAGRRLEMIDDGMSSNPGRLVGRPSVPQVVSSRSGANLM